MTYRSAIPYLSAFGVITALCMLVHLEVQQSLRQGADDPQIQMAEDAAAVLASGGQPAMGTGEVEIAKSLSPYLMVFDNDGAVIASNAVLYGQVPSLPHGVFDWVKRNGEDRISWQPRPGVRSALVVVPVNSTGGGFVASGRSLREVEKREAFALQAAAGVWAVLVVGVFLSIFLYQRTGRIAASAESRQITSSFPSANLP